MKYDIIILSYSKTEDQVNTTKNCIQSLVNAKNKIGVDIYVIESYSRDIKFDDARTIYWVGEDGFNYNESMNYGFSLSKNDHVFFCNNDLIFNDHWADRCHAAFKMGFKSISPYCKYSHPRFKAPGDYLIVGYQVGFHLPGWCIGVDRGMFESLGGFNTAVRFWYSDNIYAEQLKIAGVKHALVCNAFVDHLGSLTLKSLDDHNNREMTTAQKKVFNKEVKKLYKNAEKKEDVH